MGSPHDGLGKEIACRALCTNLWMAVDGLCRTASSLCTIRSETVDTKAGLGSLQGCYLEEHYLHPVHDGERLSCPHATPQLAVYELNVYRKLTYP